MKLKKTLVTLALVAGVSVPVIAKWGRLPSVDKKPVAMSVLSGTTVDSSKGISPAAGLLLGDPMKAITLSSGRSEAVLKFVKPSLVRSISFVSEGLEGKAALAISGDGKAWNSLGQSSFATTDRLIKIDAGAAQGKFLRLQFDLTRGGVIRGFQAIGGDTDGNYQVTQNDDNSGTPVNFAAGIGGGRLVYLSPELLAARGDAVRGNQLEFPESNERFRTAVYDLGQVRTLNEFGSVHSPRPVRFAVYAFDTLPEKEDWRGRLAFDPTVLDAAEPVARAEDTSGSGRLTAKPAKEVKARYLALRWEPDFNPPAFSAFGVNISGNGSITYSGAGNVVVTTTVDADGNTVSTITVDGQLVATVTIDPSGNTVSVTNADGETQSSDGGGGGGGDESDDNGGANQPFAPPPPPPGAIPGGSGGPVATSSPNPSGDD